jgi:formylglycine-generating enzyme required for sulfatase activity
MVNTSDNATAYTGYDTNSTNKGWYENNSGSARHLTGTSVATENANRVNNIWDMAGNVTEWTTENCKYSSKYSSYSYVVCRGGHYGYSGSDIPAAYRSGNDDNTYGVVGFRAVLYK